MFSLFAQSKAALEVVSSFSVERPSNIAVSPEGRVFITMSAEGETKHLVREILSDGKVVGFPDTSWITKPRAGSIKGINSAIGIQVSADHLLWVLDMGNKKTEPIQGPKLIAWDIKTRKLVHIYPLPDAVLRPTSFLQDFVIDEKRQIAILADMTMAGMVLPAFPAFVVIDLKTGYSRRVLENHSSFQPVDESLVVNGRPVSHRYPDGREYHPKYPLNPISIDQEMNWVYFGALGGNKIYRISAAAIADEVLTHEELGAKIEYYAAKPKSDGFKVGSKGEIYVTDVEHNSIGIVSPVGYRVLIKDKVLLSWPDGLALAPDGYLYIVADQLHNKPYWNNNQNVSKPPYYVLRIRIK
ncbi:hypothetical protein BFS30_20820 [Pedobacter steynii]|uniref:Major royal jelly protein n=2 Tax=Pedobacter steynii TaxID=430522 RepID=A0A1D7QQH6_9SPHI|nr:hypothetical protein BFS30_20820 [Pedobacter steynii]